MPFEIEKDWQTGAGFRAVVGIVVRDGGVRSHRCGYVGVPPWHPLHRVSYSQQHPCLTQSMANAATLGVKSPILVFTAGVGADEGAAVRRSPDVVFDVHGGLTFSDGDNDYPAPSDGLWWFGFDAAHCDDGYIDEDYNARFSLRGGLAAKSLEYMAQECERLAAQIAAICPAPGADFPNRPMSGADIGIEGE